MRDASTDHDVCGCCEPVAEPVVSNPPGAPSIRYRIGTHGSFLARMLERIPFQSVPLDGGGASRPLAGLSTREPSDPAIAVLDAWAVIGDILTFYQERIANEGFLGTATERRSIHELASAIGYALKPGVAASTFLAFTIDPPAPVPPPLPALPPPVQHPTPTTIAVPIGSKVQSVPGPGQLPQTFETVEAIEARVAWNALRPRQLQRQQIGVAAHDRLTLRGVAGLAPCHRLFVETASANLNPGDWLVVRVAGDNRDPSDPVSAKVTTGVAIVRVAAASPDHTQGRTRVTLRNAAHRAPRFEVPARPAGVVSSSAMPLTAATVRAAIVERSWDERELAAQIAVQGWSPERLAAQITAILASAPAPASLWVQRKSASAFGANAPAFATLPPSVQDHLARSGNWDRHPRSVWQNAAGALRRRADLFLDRVVDGVVPGGWAILEARGAPTTLFQIQAVSAASLAEYATSGKATGLHLRHADGSALTEDYKRHAGAKFGTRTTTIWLASEMLPVGPAPIDEPVGHRGKGTDRVILDGLALGLRHGQVVAIEGVALDEHGAPLGAPRREVAVVAQVEHTGGISVITLESPLSAAYDRATLGLCGNVARATHGETVASEILGSGDGTDRRTAFAIKRPPLTLVSAPTASGTASTLTVRVDGAAWHEVATLLDAGRRDRVYQVKTDDAGQTTVIFGDGVRGARPPTGDNNVVATYRTGIGLAGDIAAGSLTLLQSRPLGLRSVVNPVDATGAEDPEPAALARRNAPRTVRTLDRIVSLSDYEDFARGFAGIGKARGVALWDGDGRLVHVTVAAVDGSALAATSALYRNLVAAIARLGDGIERFAVGDFVPRHFALEAALEVDPDRRPADVVAAAEAAVRDAYSFAGRDLAQPVTESEIVTTLLGIPGVIAARITRLHRTDRPIAAEPVIGAADARWNAATRRVDPAELLTLLATSLRLSAVVP